MQLWMASRGYSVIQQNNYPTGKYAVAIVATLIYTAISDRIRSRWECSLAIGVTFVVGSAILVAHPANDGAYFFAFYLLGSTFAPQALWYTWMADLTAQDVQLRAITTGFMNSFDFAFVSCKDITRTPQYLISFMYGDDHVSSLLSRSFPVKRLLCR
jgi:MFS transporter, ACS family, pantothenate transporter